MMDRETARRQLESLMRVLDQAWRDGVPQPMPEDAAALRWLLDREQTQHTHAPRAEAVRVLDDLRSEFRAWLDTEIDMRGELEVKATLQTALASINRKLAALRAEGEGGQP